MKTGMRTLLPIALASVLGGCLAAQHRNPSGFTDEQQRLYDYFVSQGVSKDNATLVTVSPVARQLYFDDQKCRSYGAKPGSDAYVACRAQLETGSKPLAAPIVVQQGGGDYYPVPASDAPPIPNILPPTVRCQSVPAGLGTIQTICR